MSQITRKGFLRYFKNTFWVLAERVLRVVAGLFVGVYVARYLGPSDFGVLSYCVSFAALFGVVANLGLDGILVRELVKDKSLQERLLSISLTLKLAASAAVVFVVFVLLNFYSPDDRYDDLVLVVVFGLFFQSFVVIDCFYQAEVKSRYVVQVQVVQLFLSSVLKLYFVYKEAPLDWFVYLVVFDFFVLAFGLVVVFLYQQKKFVKLGFDMGLAKQLLKSAWPLMLSGIVVTIYMKIDQVMLMRMVGPEENGTYAAAVKISEAWYFLPMAITASLFPAIIDAKERSPEVYKARMQVLYDLLFWAGLVVALVVSTFSNELISLLYGEDYKASGEILQLHIWAGVLVSLAAVHGKWLLVENMQYLNVYYTVTGCVVNVVGNYFLIPSMGGYGAAIATILSQALPYLWLLVFSKGRMHFVYVLGSFNLFRIFNTWLYKGS